MLFAVSAFLVVWASLSWAQAPNPRFSGVYLPNLVLNGEDYTASFLMSKARFLDTRKMVSRVNVNTGGEAVSVSLTRREDPCPRCRQVMTRDYFDLMIEHMSPTSNMLSEKGEDANIFMRNLRRSSAKLRDAPPAKVDESRLQDTVAIIIYSSRAVAVEPTPFQKKTRKYFFLSTFWSVHRYMPNVAVFVESEQDYHAVRNLTLPYFKLIRIPPVNGIAFNLIKQAVLQVMDNLEKPPAKDNEWQRFKYVYFTEGDQVLHMRSYTDLYDVVDFNHGFTMLLPHRVQTLNLLKKLPWHEGSTEAEKAVQMGTNMVVENITEAAGSCCDNGRYKFAECGNWWYWCPKWGTMNLHYWMQFDKTGLTMPMITEHQANCVYSSVRQQCPVPAECKYRTLPKLGPTEDPQKDYFCHEMPLVQYVGDASKGKRRYLREGGGPVEQ